MFAARSVMRRSLLAAALVLSACSVSPPPAAVVVDESMVIDPADELEPAPIEETGDQTVTEAGDDTGNDTDDADDARQDSIEEQPSTTVHVVEASDEPSADEIDELLVELQQAGFCDPADVEEEGAVTAMHFVVAGEIQDPCYVDSLDDQIDVSEVVVDDDPRLIDAWNLLTEITPIELVDDISLVAGFESCATCTTLAFVSQLDEAGTFFVVAVDVVAAVEDPDELRLTMMHELTHVFGQQPGTQLIVTDGPSGCDTFFNGSGCFTEDSYLWAWIQEFWPTEIRDALPADGSVDDDETAADRCAGDAGYTGSYAAVHPEEDFAETFSAYVFDVEVDEALAEKMAFFDRYPEFVAIRENARAAGYAGTEANFEGCGL